MSHWQFHPSDSLRHRDGGIYLVLHHATRQDCRQPVPCYVYQDEFDQIHVRCKLQMEDGRFALIVTPEG